MLSLIKPRRDHQLKSQFVKKSNEYESEPFSGVTVKDTLVKPKFRSSSFHLRVFQSFSISFVKDTFQSRILLQLFNFVKVWQFQI